MERNLPVTRETMDSHTASAVRSVLKGKASIRGLVHLGPSGVNVESKSTEGDSDECSSESCSSEADKGKISRGFMLSEPSPAEGTSTVATGSTGDCSSLAEILRSRLRVKAQNLLPRPMDQLNCSNKLFSYAPASISVHFSDADPALLGSSRILPDDTDMCAYGSSSLYTADRPVPLVNLARRDDLTTAGQPGRQQVGGGGADAIPQPTEKKTVGNVVTSDVSHLALDCRDIALFADMGPSELATALCRWSLRRIFRADWSRDCFLCDMPLNHSCLMCFCALHTAQDQEAARSYNAVVCCIFYTSCLHVYHRHCWARWESELSPCCPKCNSACISGLKEIFLIEKRCG